MEVVHTTTSISHHTISDVFPKVEVILLYKKHESWHVLQEIITLTGEKINTSTVHKLSRNLTIVVSVHVKYIIMSVPFLVSLLILQILIH